MSGYLPLTGGTLTGALTANKGLVVQGRVFNKGDDEGIVVKPASNGYAGIILGDNNGDRTSIYYYNKEFFFRMWKGNDNKRRDVFVPFENGTLALTSQIPTNNNQLTNGAGYITSSGSCAYAATSGVANSVAWSGVTGKPTTLSGYGITDGLYNVQVEYEQSGVNISWLEDIVKTHGRAFVYNKYDVEYSYLIGMTSSDYLESDIPRYGAILKMGYNDTYLRLLRRSKDTWLSNDWEKISAGFADSADKLQTARTIWGQRFDGTSNVDGNLSCNGQGSFNSLQIGNITIIYDEANKGLRIAGGGLYTDSYLSSLGVDASTALSVKKWADSIQITTESDSELATAYSIGNLYRMINSNQKSIQELLNQSVSALQGRCTSLENRVLALENKVNK